MTRYLVTCGTSFKQSLCWDLEDLLPHDLDIWEQNNPKVPSLRRKVSDRIDLLLGGQSAVLEDQAQALFKTFIRVLSDQSWRYPAEADTLMVMEQEGMFADQEGDVVCLLHSEPDDGILAGLVLKRMIEKRWPDLTVTRQKVEGLDLRKSGDHTKVYQRLRDTFKEWIQGQHAVLVVTGGYKLMSMAAAAAAEEPPPNIPFKMVYKFEEKNGLVVWEIDEKGKESFRIDCVPYEVLF